MTKQIKHEPDKAGVIIFPPLLFLLAILLSILIHYVLPTPLVPFPVALLIGITLLIVAVVILRSAVKTLLTQRTTVNPGGATTAVVKTGIFQFSRNPMYVSFTIIFMAVSIMLNAWYGMMLLIPLLMITQKGIIEREEKYLTQKFGEYYISYKRKVNRWFQFKQNL